MDFTSGIFTSSYRYTFWAGRITSPSANRASAVLPTRFYKPALAVANHSQRRPLMLRVCVLLASVSSFNLAFLADLTKTQQLRCCTRCLHWFVLSLVLVSIGAAIHLTHDCTSTPGLCTGGLNMPWNTDLYSLPFLLFTSGVSGPFSLLCANIPVHPHTLKT